MNTASLAYVGGYVVRVIEKEISCEDCLCQISVPACSSPLLQFIKYQDKGSLKYPSKSLVFILSVIQEFCEYSFKHVSSQGIYHVIMNQVIGKLTEVFTKMCSKPEHSSILAKLLCEKFIKAIIENIAQKHTNMFENIRKFTVKPVNRKLLKLS